MHSRCVLKLKIASWWNPIELAFPTLQEMTRIMVHCSKGSTGNVNAVLLSRLLCWLCANVKMAPNKHQFIEKSSLCRWTSSEAERTAAAGVPLNSHNINHQQIQNDNSSLFIHPSALRASLRLIWCFHKLWTSILVFLFLTSYNWNNWTGWAVESADIRIT